MLISIRMTFRDININDDIIREISTLLFAGTERNVSELSNIGDYTVYLFLFTL